MERPPARANRRRGAPISWESPSRALQICAACPVMECREHAAAVPEPFGIWGGTTPQQRGWDATGRPLRTPSPLILGMPVGVLVLGCTRARRRAPVPCPRPCHRYLRRDAAPELGSGGSRPGVPRRQTGVHRQRRRQKLQLTLEIVKRSDDTEGFTVLPRK
ncbi:WhiB family transcriptional regulator [Streptoverticillium reticulum]|uniref:WhiB family transcriptional regulator n=1 Tax=Streptoverticillium reticulum TaxID=1433415 RepID=UPI0039BF8CD4